MLLHFGDKVKKSPLSKDAKINDGQMHTITIRIGNEAAFLGVDGQTIHQFTIKDYVYPVNNLYLGKGTLKSVQQITGTNDTTLGKLRYIFTVQYNLSLSLLGAN